MKKLFIFIVLLVSFCFGQTQSWRACWYANPAIDSVLHYELYIIENPDSLFLVNITSADVDSATHWVSNYPHSYTEPTLYGVFVVTADGDYMTGFLRAVNKWGKSPFSNKANIVRARKDEVPSEPVPCLPFLSK